MGKGVRFGRKSSRIDSFCRSRLMMYVEGSEIMGRLYGEKIKEEIRRVAGEASRPRGIPGRRFSGPTGWVLRSPL